MRGSALLVGGDPGIGKSTLLMQAAAALARPGHRVVYVSGEEAVAQIRLRAQRLGAADAPCRAGGGNQRRGHPRHARRRASRPDLVIIDSIQTLWTDLADCAPGTVTQVRAAAQAMIRYAKTTGAAVVLVGHVTKDGQIAGPRVVEHMVDAVLYFEGEGGASLPHPARGEEPLRPDRRDRRLRDVGQGPARGCRTRRSCSSASAMRRRRARRCSPAWRARGRCWSKSRRWSRRPRSARRAARSSAGIGPRLAMVLAVLEAHCGVRFGQHDVYLNVAGGYRISEPAADLAVAAALVSSLAGVALAGRLRLFRRNQPFGRGPARWRMRAQRLKEAEKLGFAQADAAQGRGGGQGRHRGHAIRRSRRRWLRHCRTAIGRTAGTRHFRLEWPEKKSISAHAQAAAGWQAGRRRTLTGIRKTMPHHAA